MRKVDLYKLLPRRRRGQSMHRENLESKQWKIVQKSRKLLQLRRFDKEHFEDLHSNNIIILNIYLQKLSWNDGQ